LLYNLVLLLLPIFSFNPFSWSVLMKVSKLWLMLSVSLLVAACGKQAEPTPAAQPAPAAAAAAPAANTEEKVLNVYNWPDYIAKDMLANFEKESGIKVNYQTFENNEALQAKLVAGNSGYDIVVPGAVFAKSQIEAGLLQKLDKAKIPNVKNLDSDIMGKLSKVDPGNTHLIPWAWSFTTVAINTKRVAKALGSMPMPENAWDLVFKPEYTSKLKSCGIAYLDSPTEIMPPALHYVGKDAYSNAAADHKAAGEMLGKVRKDIRIFTSAMIDDFASGKACVALGWAGDFNIAKALLPKTGGLIFFDNLAITKDAKHPNNAHAFIDYFLRPDVSAALTNELGYPTANKASVEKVTPETAKNTAVFPPAADMAVMVSPSAFDNAGRESLSAVYTSFKKGK
jgi:putrescine transport system substrate-binding protein